MVLAIGVVLLVLIGTMLRIRFARGHSDVLVGPQLHSRIQARFEPLEGARLSPEGLRSLELQADADFRDILTGVGLVPTGWSVRVVLDDVLGPVPRVHGPDGEVLTVADFEHRLREGRLELADRGR
jgi:hypothetical protein